VKSARPAAALDCPRVACPPKRQASCGPPNPKRKVGSKLGCVCAPCGCEACEWQTDQARRLAEPPAPPLSERARSAPAQMSLEVVT